MKKTISKLAIVVSLLVASTFVHSAPLAPVPFWLSFKDTNNPTALSYYAPRTNNAYILLGTNGIGTPTISWPIMGTYTSWTVTTNFNMATGTNNPGIWNNIQVAAVPDTWFFSIVVTNFWGISPIPSNVVQTGPAQSTPLDSLTIGR